MAWDAHQPTTNGARAVDQTVIAVAQLAISIGEPDANRKAGAAAVTEAAAAGARLVVLPELCDSGYVFGDDAGQASAEAGALASPVDDSDTLRQWQALAAEHERGDRKSVV